MTRTAPWPKLRRGLVAILRGIRPDEAVATGHALHDAGFEAIEVPLNSPDPFRSIEALAKALPNALVGAGTVVDPDDVARLADSGGRLLVSPNVDERVLAAAGAHGMITVPGVFTATEAFLALRCGASALKFFPASALAPEGITALRAVLPRDTVVGAVGGVSDANFAGYLKAGVDVFGIGGSLYRSGDDVATVAARAARMVKAWDDAAGG